MSIEILTYKFFLLGLLHFSVIVVSHPFFNFYVSADQSYTRTPDGKVNCKLWKAFVEYSGKTMDQTNRNKAPTALLSGVERETLLEEMTYYIMALIASFSIADTPTSQFQMFRKTTLGEVYSVFYGKVHTLPSNPKR